MVLSQRSSSPRTLKSQVSIWSLWSHDRKFSPCVKPFIQILISSSTQPKYLKSRKTVLRRFVHSNNIVHFRKPAFNGLFQTTCKRTQCWELLANNVAPTMLRPFARSFKGSQMLQQNSEYRSNDVNNTWTWCTRWTKRWPTFWHESQCPTGRALFWVKFPTVRKNARGMPRGVGGFGIDW